MTCFEPSVERIQELLKQPANHHKRLCPVYLDLVADLETPVSVFLKIRQTHSQSFLFESVSPGEKIARFSFIGSGPFKVISTGANKLPNVSPIHDHAEEDVDPLTLLEQHMKQYEAIQLPDLPIPLTGGAVGFCSFDAIRHFEPKIAPFVLNQRDVLKIPESIYMFFDTLVVFDHVFHSLKLVSHCRVNPDQADDGQALAKEYAIAQEKILQLRKSILEFNVPQISRQCPAPAATANAKPAKNQQQVDFEACSNVGKQGYMQFVKTLKEHIVEGDIFQAVPSQRLTIDMPPNVTPFDLYRQMRAINPSPYMFFLDFGDDFQVVGASPEMLVRVNAQRIVETHPIAGTRHRGKTDEEDAALAKELLEDEKERAEHIMLVDLGRNDVGRVAKPGSVHVESLMNIEKYSHVMHIVSVVKGSLREDKTVYDAYRALFPAGTLSGAPKVKAMELICSLEQEKRGLYSGSVGYFSFSGVLDTAIAIRTLVVKNNKLYCQAGGGIVYDSDPQAEYMETVNKLGSVVRTIEKISACKNSTSAYDE